MGSREFREQMTSIAIFLLKCSESRARGGEHGRTHLRRVTMRDSPMGGKTKMRAPAAAKRRGVGKRKGAGKRRWASKRKVVGLRRMNWVTRVKRVGIYAMRNRRLPARVRLQLFPRALRIPSLQRDLVFCALDTIA